MFDLILEVGVEVRYLCVGLDARSTHSLLSVTLPCKAALAVRILRLTCELWKSPPSETLE